MTRGPVSGGKGQANAAPEGRLAAVAYLEAEFFFEGQARTYIDEVTALFRSRMIVRRPSDNAAFSGVVVVEWLNVTAGTDGAPDWEYADAELIREGHAWVGVSAQQVGVVGGQAVLGEAAQLAGTRTGGLVSADPERYGTLSHPGDAYSFDIFTQAARALVDPLGPAPLGGLVPSALIATGESQSATFLATYVNSVHAQTQLFDGFMLHSRVGSQAPIDGTTIGLERTATSIRNDIEVPVIQFVTETDLTVLRFIGARQPDSDRVVTWEVAGTAHADRYLLKRAFGGLDIEPADLLGCPAPVNDGSHHETFKAALHHLVGWAVTGTPPPAGARVEVETAPGGEHKLVRDHLGNARGGIRTPSVDVPVAVLSGEIFPGASELCSLFGSTAVFDPATLAGLYPSHDDYVESYTAALARTVAAGYILEPEAEAMRAALR